MNVFVTEPSYGPPDKPLPDTRSGKSVVPTNAPVNEPVKLPVIFVSATAPLFTKFVAVTPVDVIDAKPAIVVAEAPNDIAVEPTGYCTI